MILNDFQPRKCQLDSWRSVETGWKCFGKLIFDQEIFDEWGFFEGGFENIIFWRDKFDELEYLCDFCEIYVTLPNFEHDFMILLVFALTP